jgi:serine O-acetyltransferase
MIDGSSFRSLMEDLRADAGRYSRLGGWRTNTGFWIGATYRVRRWTETLPNRFLRTTLVMPLWAANFLWRTVLNVQISRASEIGPGLCLVHPRNILMDPKAKIGNYCTIFHEVTIGTNVINSGLPVIGNNCAIYVGARILGGIAVGDDVSIGANCVVTANVPTGSMIAPAPNHIMSAAMANTLKSAPTSTEQLAGKGADPSSAATSSGSEDGWRCPRSVLDEFEGLGRIHRNGRSVLY